MELTALKNEIISFMETSGLNTIRPEDAILPEYAGTAIYEEPVLAVADAADQLFTGTFKELHVIGPHFREPVQWLASARSVVSFFMPFSEAVRASNRTKTDESYDSAVANQRCSALWLHARVEGQDLINALSARICDFFRENGFEAVSPSISPEFHTVDRYSSVWSERHVAFAAGLGTFGLSKGLITEKGMAGRFGSVITSAVLPVTQRKYSDPFEYCTMCGACQRRCPVGAIDAARGCALGKDQSICGPYLRGSYLPPHGPRQVVRYGCGKCQVGVPCEHGIPAAKG